MGGLGSAAVGEIYPGLEAALLVTYVRSEQLKLKYLLLSSAFTHSSFWGSMALKKIFAGPPTDLHPNFFRRAPTNIAVAQKAIDLDRMDRGSSFAQ
jgi:hypothetical protein